jgi:ArsR family transcriptional regulator
LGLRALADPVRLRILGALESQTRCASELCDVVGVSAPLLSHHMKALRAAGLVRASRRGRWVDYTLDRASVSALFAAVPGYAPDRTQRDASAPAFGTP